jgi:hypothetical protein
VIALDRATGAEIWRTPLKGLDFVSVVVADRGIFASTKGVLFTWIKLQGKYDGETLTRVWDLSWQPLQFLAPALTRRE